MAYDAARCPGVASGVGYASPSPPEEQDHPNVSSSLLRQFAHREEVTDLLSKSVRGSTTSTSQHQLHQSVVVRPPRRSTVKRETQVPQGRIYSELAKGGLSLAQGQSQGMRTLSCLALEGTRALVPNKAFPDQPEGDITHPPPLNQLRTTRAKRDTVSVHC